MPLIVLAKLKPPCSCISGGPKAVGTVGADGGAGSLSSGFGFSNSFGSGLGIGLLIIFNKSERIEVLSGCFGGLNDAIGGIYIGD